MLHGKKVILSLLHILLTKYYYLIYGQITENMNTLCAFLINVAFSINRC